MKQNLMTFAMLLMGFLAFSQQDSQYTQYMYNTLSVNPAYAGSRGAMSVFGLHRSQWIGLDGAPVTNAVSVHTPINESRLGFGVSFVNDKIGPTNENAISGDVSYTVPTSETWKLSFGVRATLNLFDLDRGRLNPQQADDPSLQGFNNKLSPNFGAGVYWHSDKTYVGLSVPNILETNRYSDNDVVVNKEKMNVYLIAGHVFDVSPSVKFKPAILSKMVVGAPLQVDVSGNFQFYERFVLGAAYRWDAAVSGMAGFQISDAVFIGYGYDHETTRLRNYNSGSHEIFLRFELFNNFNRIISPRFF